MKRIFITESQEKLLKKVIKESLSHDVAYNLMNMYENTPLKNLIPEKFQTKILSKREEELNHVLSKLFTEIDTSDLTNIENTISKLLTDIEKKEELIKDFLEKTCFDIVNETFAIPSGIVNISCDLVNNINNNGSVIHISPINGEPEFESSDELVSIETEVEKRMLLNILVVGASIVLTKYILKIKKNDILKLDDTI